MEQPVRARTTIGATKKLVLHVRLMCGSLSITPHVSFLAKISMFEAYCTGKWLKWACQSNVYIMRIWMVAKILRFIKGLLRNCKYQTMTIVWLCFSFSKHNPLCFLKIDRKIMFTVIHTVLPAQSDSDFIICSQSDGDLESIDHLCFNSIHRIGLKHKWYTDSR